MKRAVVTGGNSGMGRKTVELFLRQGYQVVFTSRSRKKAEAVLNDNGQAVSDGRLFFCQCDSSRSQDVAQLAAFAKEKMGGCDVLVNCAVIFVGGQVHEITEEAFDLIMDIDVKGVFLTCKALLPQMLEQNSGSIINISSLAGVRGNYNAAAYCAAKAAVNNLTRCMALDYGTRGIRANTICPSATSTDMFMCGSTQEVIDSFYKQNPMGRISAPDEIAKLAAFLASDEASFINGQCISIDGGLSAWCGEPRQDKTEVRK